MTQDQKLNMEQLMDFIMKAIDELPLPDGIKKMMSREIMKIKDELFSSRAARIIVVGRRGAGKSSLINAIFREEVAKTGDVLSTTARAEWHKYEGKLGQLEILDTRGIGDASKPAGAECASSLDEIKKALEQKSADVMLFLCKAKEVDARIEEDIKDVQEVRAFVHKKRSYPIPLAVVVTQVDELDPKNVKPPFEDAKKKKNIETAVVSLEGRIQKSGLEVMKTLPVCAWACFDNRKLVENEYWNIDALVEYLLEILPKDARLQLARIAAVKSVQLKYARRLVGMVATACGAIALEPIPVADIIPITALQVGMIIGIGYIAGLEMSKKTALEFLTAAGVNVGAAFGFREAARALVKVVFPGGGSVISAGIATAGTFAIGEAAIAYFIEKKSMAEAKEAMKKARKEHESVIN